MALQLENPPSGESKPLIRYLRAQFERVRNELRAAAIVAVQQFVTKGYGGIFLSAPVAVADISATRQVLPFDTAALPVPVHVTYDLAQNALKIDGFGIWQFQYTFAMTHDEINASRVFVMELYNLTLDTVEAQFTLGTGRNVQASDWTLATLIEVTSSNSDDFFQWRISGDAYAEVTITLDNWSVFSVGEFSRE